MENKTEVSAVSAFVGLEIKRHPRHFLPNHCLTLPNFMRLR